jgi:pimeloyl-ACP methyl ester carboxylesterase
MVPTIDVGGARVFYDEFGSGDEYVVSCQWGYPNNEGLQGWPEILAEAPTNLHVIRIVTRGYAPSEEIVEPPPDGWYATWAEDVYSVTRALGIDRFVYAGISHGGGIGWTLALAHPEVLRALVSIVGVPHDRSKPRDFRGGPERTFEDRLRHFGLAETDDPERLARRDRMRAAAAAGGRTGGLDHGFAMPEIATNDELLDHLSRVEVSTLILSGIQDGVVPAAHALAAASVVPHAKAVFFQDHGHMLASERPDQVRDEVAVFLGEVRRRELLGIRG